MKNLITVVVPIYNVEKYIHRCIDSIINQTYKDLEIILIDDDSPDNCPKICDEYVKKDDRIRVIHKKNGGLSDARNTGIKNAHGKYITFIDSDDWIPKDSIRILYEYLLKNDADIASGFLKETYIYEDDVDYTNLICTSYDKKAALECLFYLHNFSNSASGKLYKTQLFNDIRYPKGKLYEDLGTTYKIFAKANKCISIDKIVYYYFQNEYSIVHSKFSQRRYDALIFANEALDYINNNFPDIINSAYYRIFYECLSIINDMPYFYRDKNKIFKLIRKYRKIVIKDEKLYKKQKNLCFASLFGQVGIKMAFKIKNILKMKRVRK